MAIIPHLVSRGKNESNKNQCYGSHNSDNLTGWGPVYYYNCIRSGEIKISDDGRLTSNWYNYTLASAGTIAEASPNTTSSSPASNTTKATESICPKGWTLPATDDQIRTIGDNTSTYVASFSPVLGGGYYNGTLYNEDTYGFWWGSEAYNGAIRYRLYYNGGSLYTDRNRRHYGYYVRCVQKSSDSL